jgi:regulator of protease activity HflC (stomatin/prohibitin superfamily)
MRVKAVDVPTQEAITKDNITIGLNAVLYYKVVDPEKAILNNQGAPLEVVTPFLVNTLDDLRALAFVHTNTDNAEIVTVMTADDANGINILPFLK